MTNSKKRDQIRELIFNTNGYDSESRQKRIIQLIPEFEMMYHLEHNQVAHAYDVFEHTLKVVDDMPNGDELGRLAALFHDIGKPIKRFYGIDGVCHYWGHAELSSIMANEILSRLGYPCDIINAVTIMCLYHDNYLDKSYEEFKIVAGAMGYGNVITFCNLQRADLYAHAKEYYDKHKKGLEESHMRLEYFMKRVVEENLFNPD